MLNVLIVYFAAKAGTRRALRDEFLKQYDDYEDLGPAYPRLERLYIIAGFALSAYILLN